MPITNDEYCGKYYEHVQSDHRDHLRFSLEVPLRIQCRTGELVLGRTVDVSESGVSAMIPVGMVVGQAVELDFQLPSGAISVQAVVTNKTAFRYGFEFVPEHHEKETITRSCRALAFGRFS
jgi:PilZ domain